MGSTVQGRVQLDRRGESGDKVRRAKRAKRAKRQGGKEEGQRGKAEEKGHTQRSEPAGSRRGQNARPATTTTSILRAMSRSRKRRMRGVPWGQSDQPGPWNPPSTSWRRRFLIERPARLHGIEVVGVRPQHAQNLVAVPPPRLSSAAASVISWAHGPRRLPGERRTVSPALQVRMREGKMVRSSREWQTQHPLI